MGIYYIAACHTCRTQTMFPKCPKESADEAFQVYSKQLHQEHETEMSSDYDQHFEAKLDGREVTGESWFGPITKKVSEPYAKTQEGDQIFDTWD